MGHVPTELDADLARVAEVEPGPDAGIDDLAIEIFDRRRSAAMSSVS